MFRVIDRVAEETDLKVAPNDWLQMIEPFQRAVEAEVKSDPEKLYVNPGNKSGVVLSTYRGRNEFQSIPTNVKSAQNVLAKYRTSPVILVGDPGAGKTSWVYHIVDVFQKAGDSFSFNYNQKWAGHIPIHGMSDEDRFLKTFWSMLCDRLQFFLQEVDVTGLKISEYDKNDIYEFGISKMMGLRDAIIEAFLYLFEEKKITSFIFIDNIDKYSSELQEYAYNLAIDLAAQVGVSCIISLRPETLQSPLFEEKVHEPIIYTVTPPSLKVYLRSRLEYLWNHMRYDLDIDGLFEMIRDKEVSINFAYTGEIASNAVDIPDRVFDLYKNVINYICRNNILEKAIYNLHDNDLREIREIVSRIISARFFYEECKEYIESANNLKKRKNDHVSNEKVITSYLRGVYNHYRGRTDHYKIRNLNLFDPPNIDTSNVIISVRFLQLLQKKRIYSRGIGGEKWYAIKEYFLKLGYAESDIMFCTLFLLDNNFIVEIKDQTSLNSPSDITDDKTFRNSSMSNYILKELLGTYSFRYLEAMADVMSRPRLDNNKWEGGKSYLEMIYNVSGMLDIILSSAEAEQDKVKALYDSGEVSAYMHYSSEFYSDASRGNLFLRKLVEECVGMGNVLIRELQDDQQTDYKKSGEIKNNFKIRSDSFRKRVDAIENFKINM